MAAAQILESPGAGLSESFDLLVFKGIRGDTLKQTGKEIELHPIEASPLHARRERFFLLISGLFLGSLAMLNILGVSRFIVLFSLMQEADGYRLQWGQWGEISFALAVGVLPYPLTFLCTDIISEFYGRKRANWVVFVGFLVNIWVMLILWLGGIMPQAPVLTNGVPSVPIVEKEADDSKGTEALTDPRGNIRKSDGNAVELERINRSYEAKVPDDYAFYRIRTLAFGAVIASMIAYLAAQFCDVYLFHFWKRLTNGRHLWLRNNGSTLISQLVDTIAVILITHYISRGLPINDSQPIFRQLFLFIATGYVFKLVVALLDTIPFYVCVHYLKSYLEFDPIDE